MRKLITSLLTVLLCLSLAVPASASDYSFESGSGTLDGFGHSTGYDGPAHGDPLNENTRRNKDAALLPPPYFYGSGEIPTDPSSLYHDNLPDSGFSPPGQQTPQSGVEGYMPGGAAVWGGLLPSTSATDAQNTSPWHYDDGSIGSLHIPALKKTIKVYEGETLENMKKGIGHFAYTSAWDGNCGLAGHNRGAAAYFGFVKGLGIGDRITYTTRYGVRTYEVYRKEKISETDFSALGWSGENIITMITCVENQKELRWLVQARETQ